MANILVCDDEIEIGKLLQEWLDSLGHSVTLLTKPELVVASLVKERFELLILDYKMPEMSGQEVLTEVRKLFTAAEVPVVFLTGHGAKEIVVEVVKSGISGFFVKPLNFDAMAIKLPALLARRLGIGDVRAMMESCQMADKTLSKLPGLVSYAPRPSSLFSVNMGGEKLILANVGDVAPVRSQNQWKDKDIMTGIKIYAQVTGTWYQLWPTFWDGKK
jgi:DNA-binding response OmpR family regulator